MVVAGCGEMEFLVVGDMTVSCAFLGEVVVNDGGCLAEWGGE